MDDGVNWHELGAKYGIPISEFMSPGMYIKTCVDIMYADVQVRLGLKKRPQRGWT